MKKNESAWSEVKREILKQFHSIGGEEDIKLPPEMELSQLFGVSRSTVREALAKLTQEGILYKVHGKGSFLRANLSELNLDITRLVSVTDTINMVGKDLKTVIRSKEKIIANDELFKKIKTRECISIERIRYANEKLAVYNKNIFPLHLLEDANTTIMEGSLFDYFRQKGVGVAYAKSAIVPDLLTKSQLPELENEIELFLRLDETYYTDSGQVLGITSDYYRGSIFSFEVIRTLEK